jgi:hypothetical protein
MEKVNVQVSYDKFVELMKIAINLKATLYTDKELFDKGCESLVFYVCDGMGQIVFSIME